jgi:hypothetical protein
MGTAGGDGLERLGTCQLIDGYAQHLGEHGERVPWRKRGTPLVVGDPRAAPERAATDPAAFRGESVRGGARVSRSPDADAARSHEVFGADRSGGAAAPVPAADQDRGAPGAEASVPRACPELNITGVLCFLRRAGSAPPSARRCTARDATRDPQRAPHPAVSTPTALWGDARRLARCPALGPARPHVLRLGRR